MAGAKVEWKETAMVVSLEDNEVEMKVYLKDWLLAYPMEHFLAV